MINAQRLQEISRFHAALTTRCQADPAALNAFERQTVVNMMSELIEHARTTAA
ncbi:hypothetical protein [uncultured Kocuria sp.]|uniref:hypothetical protein n=1 Tax=uncultured Kocuria sp. TaxID=259305 RepID=UPI00260D71B1|nr:hypothetical protein [uncultured Kocuria sp.]